MGSAKEGEEGNKASCPLPLSDHKWIFGQPLTPRGYHLKDQGENKLDLPLHIHIFQHPTICITEIQSTEKHQTYIDQICDKKKLTSQLSPPRRSCGSSLIQIIAFLFSLVCRVLSFEQPIRNESLPSLLTD